MSVGVVKCTTPLKGVVAPLSPTYPLMVKFHLFFTAFTISPNDHFKMII